MAESWTTDRIARLKDLWGNGMTAQQIADKLGGVTRSAVIGKANRLGLAKPGRPRGARKKTNFPPSEPLAPSRDATLTPAQSVQGLAEEAPLEPPTPPSPSDRSPGSLSEHRRCQFPIGHPGEDDFHYCGHETLLNKPYCDYHCTVAYRQKIVAA